uniref:Uncharacterized protein n=1 Tax=Plectus sambesii TaxID=2011161 RepID=A0A914WPG1_9BILA
MSISQLLGDKDGREEQAEDSMAGRHEGTSVHREAEGGREDPLLQLEEKKVTEEARKLPLDINVVAEARQEEQRAVSTVEDSVVHPISEEQL